MKSLIPAIVITVASAFSLPAMAMDVHGSHDAMTQKQPAAVAQWVEGSVKKVDRAAGKVTLSHGPLVNLDMPAMTMTFRVKDATWLDQMKAGDKIRFVADSLNGSLTVVRFETVK